MSVYKQERGGRSEQEFDGAPQNAPQMEPVDDILAEIDAVLDVNAEEFVRSFVQKGGQ